MPKALIILGLAVAGHLASVEVTLVMLDCSWFFTLHFFFPFLSHSRANDCNCLLQQFITKFCGILHGWSKNYFMSYLAY